MKKKNKYLRAILFVLFCFFLDTLKPFGYFFLPDLTLLAIISVFFYNKLFFCLFLGIFAGSLKDSLIFPGSFYYTFTYVFLALFIFVAKRSFYFIKMKNHPEAAKLLLVAFLISTYSVLNIFITRVNNFSFLIHFFIQSYLAFFLIDYLIQHET